MSCRCHRHNSGDNCKSTMLPPQKLWFPPLYSQKPAETKLKHKNLTPSSSSELELPSADSSTDISNAWCCLLLTCAFFRLFPPTLPSLPRPQGPYRFTDRHPEIDKSRSLTRGCNCTVNGLIGASVITFKTNHCNFTADFSNYFYNGNILSMPLTMNIDTLNFWLFT